MKKKLVLCLFIVLALVVGCDNEPYDGQFEIFDNSCELAMNATAIAEENFLSATNENYEFLCDTYRNALLHQIEVCGDNGGFLQVKLIDLGSCFIDTSACDEAIAQVEVTRNDFLTNTDLSYQILCNAYRSALQIQIIVCGDDGTLQAIVEDLGDCEPVFVETLGTWQVVAWLTDQSRDIDNDGIVTNNYLEEIDCYTNETLTFNSDGTGKLFLRSLADITYTPLPDAPDEEDFFVTCNAIMEDKPFTWIQNGNTITFIFQDGSSLNYFRNANSLFVAIDDAFSATSTLDGVSQINERITYVYIKL